MKNSKIIIDPNNKYPIITLSNLLYDEIFPAVDMNKSIVFLCIGTDRSTGDSLGPLVGDKLRFLNKNNISIYGNLKFPVHAKNLNEIINSINNKNKNSFIVAIDSSLGSIQDVGKIILEKKPLRPGSALNKKLPQIGNLSLTGIVNISGTLEFMILQNTRLFTVMTLADIISSSIYNCIIKLLKSNKYANKYF